MTVGILSLETHSSEIQNSPLTCSTLCDCQAALAHCSRVIQPKGRLTCPAQEVLLPVANPTQSMSQLRPGQNMKGRCWGLWQSCQRSDSWGGALEAWPSAGRKPLWWTWPPVVGTGHKSICMGCKCTLGTFYQQSGVCPHTKSQS